MATAETRMVLVGEKRCAPSTVRKMMLECRERMDSDYVDGGLALMTIMDQGLHKMWGFKSFEEYVEAELGWKEQKAYYLLRIARFYSTALAVPKDRLVAVGVAKALALMMAIRKDHDSWKKWFKFAEKASLSDVKAAVKQFLLEDGQKGAEAGNGSAAAADSPEEGIHKFTVSLYDAQLATVEQAIEIAFKVCQDAGTPTDKKGHALEMVCLAFLADNPVATKDMHMKIIRSAARMIGKKVRLEDG